MHARAQTLHFGVQKCRSHANKTLLTLLTISTKHVTLWLSNHDSMMIFRKVTETYTVQEPAAFLHKRRFWILLVVESNILSDQRAGMVTLHLYKTEQKFGPPQLCR